MMKPLLISALLFAGLASCKKEESDPPPGLAAQINGQNWVADPKSSPYTAVVESYNYIPVHYLFSVEGASRQGVPGLNLSFFGFKIAFSYLPKIGRHAINAGANNAKQNECRAHLFFDAPDKATYSADATSGYVEITEIAGNRITGTFELTCPATPYMPPTSGAPAVFNLTHGRFQGVVSATLPNKPLTWDGEQ